MTDLLLDHQLAIIVTWQALGRGVEEGDMDHYPVAGPLQEVTSYGRKLCKGMLDHVEAGHRIAVARHRQSKRLAALESTRPIRVSYYETIR